MSVYKASLLDLKELGNAFVPLLNRIGSVEYRNKTIDDKVM